MQDKYAEYKGCLMLHRILCAVGFHKWWRNAPDVIENGIVKCKYCGKTK